jgi:hypothetical protein
MVLSFLFELTTDAKNDFSGLSAANQTRILGLQAFTGVPNEGTTIFIRTDTADGFYQLSQSNGDYTYYGASALSHEQRHNTAQPGHEHKVAFQRQLDVFVKFKHYYQSRTLYQFDLEGIQNGANGNVP